MNPTSEQTCIKCKVVTNDSSLQFITSSQVGMYYWKFSRFLPTYQFLRFLVPLALMLTYWKKCTIFFSSAYNSMCAIMAKF